MHKKSLKEHRLLMHLSQKELADRARVSLRTIQRIEKSESVGSPYVIRNLCEALGIETGNLFIANQERNSFTEGESSEQLDIPLRDTMPSARAGIIYLKYINLSALSLLLFPFSNLVTVPLVYFIFKKRLHITQEKVAALKLLSFQVLWTFVAIVVMILTSLTDYFFLHIGDVLEVPLFIWSYVTLVFIHLTGTLLIASRLNSSKNYMPGFPNFF